MAETTDLVSGMPLTTEADVTMTVNKDEKTMTTAKTNNTVATANNTKNIRPSLKWVLARLDTSERSEFIALALARHPLTGKSRQEALRVSGVKDSQIQRETVGLSRYRQDMLKQNSWMELRLGEANFKLNRVSFDHKAKAWFLRSQRFMDLIKDAAWHRSNRKVHLLKAGYLWISRR